MSLTKSTCFRYSLAPLCSAHSLVIATPPKPPVCCHLQKGCVSLTPCNVVSCTLAGHREPPLNLPFGVTHEKNVFLLPTCYALSCSSASLSCPSLRARPPSSSRSAATRTERRSSLWPTTGMPAWYQCKSDVQMSPPCELPSIPESVNEAIC